ncbi:hypothetical protein DASC09_054350 [Saccharomycopsis crataegensis]|uniref:Uncharacterized protein n=1 Tax=Saccharomycopsis crataegensis TaxID=43959 RepID=A0AAV5QT54_9ASCO|nr:hypothetical protein DASC09_054350 [Saccharomycopsis crataegensis]
MPDGSAALPAEKKYIIKSFRWINACDVHKYLDTTPDFDHDAERVTEADILPEDREYEDTDNKNEDTNHTDSDWD